MMHYLYIALIGLVIGFIARALHPGKDNIGFIMTAVLGIAGSFAATFLGKRWVYTSKVKTRASSCR